MSVSPVERPTRSPVAGPLTGPGGSLGVGPTAGPVESPVARPEEDVREQLDADLDRGWITLVWNDPVNLMSYVTYVFQTYFGYSKSKAERLMLDVHHKGRAVVAHGPREQMEQHTEALHGYGLWATFQKDE